MRSIFLALAATALSTPFMAGADPVKDGSFEVQGAGQTGSCYFAIYGTPCATGAWSGTGETSGILRNGVAGFLGNSPDGNYFGFVQSYYGQSGGLIQTLNLNAGSYRLSWLDAGRADGDLGNQTYTVSMDGNLIATDSVITGQAFSGKSQTFSVSDSGSHVLAYTALVSAGDNTAFIDGVSVVAVPEPATWAMMLLGFGMVGVGLRYRRKSTTARVA